MTDFLTDFADDRDVDYILDEEEWEQRVSPPGFHAECGYRWDRHDNRDLLNRLPFGCPTSELRVRRAEGDR